MKKSVFLGMFLLPLCTGCRPPNEPPYANASPSVRSTQSTQASPQVLLEVGHEANKADKSHASSLSSTPTQSLAGKVLEKNVIPPSHPFLHGEEFLGSFFSALHALDARYAPDDLHSATQKDEHLRRSVIITQIGDSHTAGDMETRVMRETLQHRFGNAGLGLISLGAPFRPYVIQHVRGEMSKKAMVIRGGGNPSPHHGNRTHASSAHHQTPHKKSSSEKKTHHNSSTPLQDESKTKAPNPPSSMQGGDGHYGLLGLAVETSQASLFTHLEHDASRLEIAYDARNHGGDFQVFINKELLLQVPTKSETRSVGYASASLMSFQKPFDIEIRPKGNGPVRVYGASIEKDSHGIMVDALGVIGARASTQLLTDTSHFKEMLEHRSPKLVVLAFGTNESADTLNISNHAASLTSLILRVKEALPESSCLILGLPDRAIQEQDGSWITPTRVAELDQMQEEVAKQNGCAFFSQYKAMGGAGTMALWASLEPKEDRKGRSDRVHYTKDGYKALGETFAGALLAAYEAYQKRSQLPLPN